MSITSILVTKTLHNQFVHQANRKKMEKKKRQRSKIASVQTRNLCGFVGGKKVHKCQLPNASVSLFFQVEVGFWSLLRCPHLGAFFHDAASHTSPTWEVVVSCFGSWVLGPSRKVRSLRFLVWGFVAWAAVETAGLGRRVFGWLACEGVLRFWGDVDCLPDSVSLSFTCTWCCLGCLCYAMGGCEMGCMVSVCFLFFELILSICFVPELLACSVFNGKDFVNYGKRTNILMANILCQILCQLY